MANELKLVTVFFGTFNMPNFSRAIFSSREHGRGWRWCFRPCLRWRASGCGWYDSQEWYLISVKSIWTWVMSVMKTELLIVIVRSGTNMKSWGSCKNYAFSQNLFLGLGCLSSWFHLLAYCKLTVLSRRYELSLNEIWVLGLRKFCVKQVLDMLYTPELKFAFITEYYYSVLWFWMQSPLSLCFQRTLFTVSEF